jgi:chromate transporter
VSETRPALQRRVTFPEALRYWLKLGFISFGGPAGQIAIMHHELVEHRRWISEQRYLHALNYCMLLPGPEAQQLATYIGWLMHGVKGGIAAGALFVLPSLFVLIALSWIYMAYGSVPLVAGVLYGVKPAVVAIVLFAAWRIGSRALRHPVLWSIAAAAFAAIFLLQVPFPAIVLSAGCLGLVGSRFAPQAFRLGGHAASRSGSAAQAATQDSAIIDDDTPTPAHARWERSRFWRLSLAGIAIWAAVMVLVGVTSGWSGTLRDIAWFFTKAALLTFGGAYAVLPYVNQAAVEGYGWLTPLQMIDGLALGETTPGPLIMVVAFVGFVAGWTRELFGPDALFAAGVAAATAATFFTFLPSFLFILVGGPLVEATHGEIRFTAPLTAITAAVVGVILDLALYFGQHVLWPRGLDESFEWPAAIAAVAAAAALIRFKIGVVTVILACAVAGMGWHMLLR